jgi:hypothetical protein
MYTKDMFYLIKRTATKNLELWETDTDNELVVNFVQVLHIVESVDNFIAAQLLRIDPNTCKPLEKTTTVAHIGNMLIACSDSYEAIVGAATIENLAPTPEWNNFEGLPEWNNFEGLNEWHTI